MLNNLGDKDNSGSLIRIATIRKGTAKAPVKSGDKEIMGMGQDLGELLRFRPECKDPYKAKALSDLFIAKFGSLTPKEIRCCLDGDTPEQVFYSFYTFQKGEQMIRECDGINVLREFNPATQRTPKVNKPCYKPNDDRYLQCTDCKTTNKLHVYIPELADLVDLGDGTHYRFFGGVDVISQSVSDAKHIEKRLKAYAAIAAVHGKTLRGMPVRIYRVEETRAGADRRPQIKVKGKIIDNPNFMKSMRQKRWFLEVELDIDAWMRKLQSEGVNNLHFISGSPEPLAIAPSGSVKQKPSLPASPLPVNATPVPAPVLAKDPAQKFIETVEGLIARMKDLEMFVDAEDWIVVQAIYKNNPEVQAKVNAKMDEAYKTLSAQNLKYADPNTINV